jgi:rhodanese-related sulfurtransferase
MSLTADKYISQLHHCIPISSMVKKAFERLKTETEFIIYKKDQRIFSIGDNDEDSLFLLEGEIKLVSKDGKYSTISTDNTQSLYAIAALKPRLFSALATKGTLIAKIKTKILDKLLIWEQSTYNSNNSSVEVKDLPIGFDESDSDREWKMSMLQTQIFLTLPAANIITLFDKMENIEVKKDQQIIKQGVPGDYYYMIKKGFCQVSRRFQDNKEAIILGELGPTECFGEEALVSGESRNARVIMKTDGILVRLAKEDFHLMLEEPLLEWVERKQAEQLTHDGAIPIDVRMEEEYANSGIANTLNIPLYLLRLKMKNLDKNSQYILFCDTGARSSAAAFLMAKEGFKHVFILKDGLLP